MANKKHHDFNPRENRWRAALRWKPALTYTEFAMLCSHFVYTNAKGTHFPSVKTLAEEAETRPDKASKANNRLIDLGIIKKCRGGGRGRRNDYRVDDKVFYSGPTSDQVRRRGTQRANPPQKKSNQEPANTPQIRGSNTPQIRGKHPPNQGAKHPPKRGRNTPQNGAVEIYKGKINDLKDQIKGQGIDLSLSDFECKEVSRLAKESGISKSVIDAAESACPGSVIGALTLTRGKALAGELRNPSGYATSLLKTVAKKGVEATAIAKLNGEINYFRQELDEGLESLTTPHDDGITDFDKFLATLRSVCPEDLVEEVDEFINGQPCYDNPDAAGQAIYNDVVECLTQEQVCRFKNELGILKSG